MKGHNAVLYQADNPYSVLNLVGNQLLSKI